MPISGSSPNKTYTRSDGTRTGSAVCVQERDVAVLNNTAELADARENDLATGINAMLMKDGGNAATGDIPMGGYKLTGLAAGSTSGDSVRYEQMNAAIAAAISGAASESASGIIELATTAEVQTGTDALRAVTPAGLQACTATETRKGVVELATDAETQTGTDTARAITPANLQACTATDTRKGVVELATSAEAITGTDTARALTPADLAATWPATAYDSYATCEEITDAIPSDDTIPQKTEGKEILSVAITPKRAANRIRIEFQGQVCSTTSFSVALFVDSGADAVCAENFSPADAASRVAASLVFEHSPSTTSAVTYSLRIGPASGTLVLNGYYMSSATRRMGGVSIATLTATEIFA